MCNVESEFRWLLLLLKTLLSSPDSQIKHLVCLAPLWAHGGCHSLHPCLHLWVGPNIIAPFGALQTTLSRSNSNGVPDSHSHA